MGCAANCVSVFSKASRPTLGPSQLHIQCVLEADASGGEWSPPSNAEVKNKMSYTSTASHDKYFAFYTFVGRDSSVGIETRFGLNGPGIESRWGGGVSVTIETGPGAHPAS